MLRMLGCAAAATVLAVGFLVPSEPATAAVVFNALSSGCSAILVSADSDDDYSYLAVQPNGLQETDGCRIVATGDRVSVDVTSADLMIVYLPGATEVTFSLFDTTSGSRADGDAMVIAGVLPTLDSYQRPGSSCNQGVVRRTHETPTLTGNVALEANWLVAQPAAASSPCEYAETELDISGSSTVPVATPYVYAIGTPIDLAVNLSATESSSHIDYLIDVSNPTTIPFELTVTEQTGALAVSCDPPVLPPNGSARCSGRYLLTPADLATGVVTHTFIVGAVDSGLPGRIDETNGTGASAPVSTTVEAIGQPAPTGSPDTSAVPPEPVLPPTGIPLGGGVAAMLALLGVGLTTLTMSRRRHGARRA